VLKSDAESKAVYPFDFELRVIYKLLASGLTTTYRVDNPAATPLYFSVGGHPAFKIPIVPETTYTDYYLQFNQSENAPRWPISKDGLIETQPQPLLNNASTIPLKKELFAKDALVFKHPASSAVAIRSSKTERGVKLDFPGFPFLGIWAAPNADFVCLEPWCGIADSVDSDQQFTKKEGINVLAEGEEFERTWMLTVL
jgi:galactose mutarotase-like enzyme